MYYVCYELYVYKVKHKLKIKTKETEGHHQLEKSLIIKKVEKQLLTKIKNITRSTTKITIKKTPKNSSRLK